MPRVEREHVLTVDEFTTRQVDRLTLSSRRVERYSAKVRGSLEGTLVGQLLLNRSGLVGALLQTQRIGERPLVFRIGWSRAARSSVRTASSVLRCASSIRPRTRSAAA